MDNTLRNILLGISLAAPLGPSSVAVIQNGLKWGFLRAFLTGLGVTMADTTYLLVVFFGLSGFIGIPAVKIVVWLFGAGVLLYLGISGLREAARGAKDLPGPQETKSTPPATRNPVLVGYLINISNPIAVVWWVGIFGSLLGSGEAGSTQAETLLGGGAILIGILCWHSTMSLLTHWGKRLINPGTMRVITLLAGIALVIFGIRFGYFAISTLLEIR